MSNNYMSPQLKFYRTSAAIYRSKQNSYRTRTQGLYSPKGATVSEKGLSEEKMQEDQYVDLTVESIKKNYNVGNLKPFAVNKNLIKSLKKQVQELKQKPSNQLILDNMKKIEKSSLNEKLYKVLNIARLKGRNKKERKKFYLKHLIDTDLQDDHENLILDYQEEIKNQKMHRQKTILDINNQILQRYSAHVDMNTQMTSQKQKILKFKKETKVAKKYATNNEETLRQQIMNYAQNAPMQIQKQDYGIYSRSANRALYFKSVGKNIRKKQAKSISSSNLRIDKKFYLGYLSSYSQRRNMLTNSIGI